MAGFSCFPSRRGFRPASSPASFPDFGDIPADVAVLIRATPPRLRGISARSIAAISALRSPFPLGSPCASPVLSVHGFPAVNAKSGELPMRRYDLPRLIAPPRGIGIELYIYSFLKSLYAVNLHLSRLYCKFTVKYFLRGENQWLLAKICAFCARNMDTLLKTLNFKRE